MLFEAESVILERLDQIESAVAASGSDRTALWVAVAGIAGALLGALVSGIIDYYRSKRNQEHQEKLIKSNHQHEIDMKVKSRKEDIYFEVAEFAFISFGLHEKICATANQSSELNPDEFVKQTHSSLLDFIKKYSAFYDKTLGKLAVVQSDELSVAVKNMYQNVDDVIDIILEMDFFNEYSAENVSGLLEIIKNPSANLKSSSEVVIDQIAKELDCRRTYVKAVQESLLVPETESP